MTNGRSMVLRSGRQLAGRAASGYSTAYRVGKAAYKAYNTYHRLQKGRKERAVKASRVQEDPATNESKGATENIILNVTVNKEYKGGGRMGGRIVQRITYGLNVASAAGFQGVSVVSKLCTPSQFLTSTAVAATQALIDPGTSPKGFFKLDPNEYNSGGVTFAAGQAITQQFMVMSHVQNNLLLKNATSSDCEVKILVCLAKDDLPAVMNAGNAMLYGIRNQVLSPSTAFVGPTPGYAAAPTWGATEHYYPFTNPKDSDMFNKAWKVLKGKTIMLAGQASAKVSISINMNKLFSEEYLASMLGGMTTYDAIKGKTINVVFITRGMPVVDITGAAGTAREVTIGGTSLLVVSNVKYNMRPIALAAKKATLDYALLQVPANTAVDKERIASAATDGLIAIVDAFGAAIP